MNILLLGSGGREHALAWKMNQSEKLTKLYVAPGNAGTLEISENIDIDLSDFNLIKKHTIDKKIDIVVVGPEQPLVEGISDYFLTDPDLKNIPVIGPVKAGAILEGSKDYAKEFMTKYNIPTAKYKSFKKSSLESGKMFLESLSAPYFVNGVGLSARNGC